MLVTLNQYRAHHIVEAVAHSYDLPSYLDCLERELTFPAEVGEGKMVSFKLSDGISFLMMNGRLNEDLVIQMPADIFQPIIFSYVLNGTLTHSLDNGLSTYMLEALQSSITTNVHKTAQEFVFLGGPLQTIILIMIDREEYLKKVDCYVEQMPDKMQELFRDAESKNNYLYESQYSFKIGDIVNDISKDLNKDVVRSTYIESKILELISYSIRQFRDEQAGLHRQAVLRQADVIKIQEAKTILEKQLFNPPTIKELSVMVGVNQNKLKFGFKEIFDTTIKAYVINQRLELARVLILAEAKTLKEVATEIGYSNYSHFSRLFKRKYGLLPKDYAKHTSRRMGIIADTEAE